MNCFTFFPYTKRYYLSHPWAFITQCWRNLRAAWQRATTGSSFYDRCDMYTFLLALLSSMLRSATHEAPGYNDYAFDSMEDYQNFLAALADMFDAVKDENWENEGNNEWWEIYHDSIHNPNDYSDKEAEEARSNFWSREVKLSEERKAMTKEAFAQLAEHLYNLWY